MYRKTIKIISSIIQILIGAVFVSPLINHPERIKEEGVGWAMVFIGSMLLVIGSIKLYTLLKKLPDSSESESFLALEVKKPNVLVAVGWLLIKMSYLVVALTIIGALYMAVFVGSGGASGIPIVFGTMLAGILYVLGKSCK